MTRAHWWLVDKLSWTLEPAERDAVCGDLLEAGETGGRALLNVLGLVVRRQSGLWKNWRPWATLVGLGAPLGILLSVVSRRMAGGTAIPIWMYVNNWTMVYLESPGARSDLVNNFAGILKGYLLLACWSWATGHARVSLPPNHFSQRRPILPCRVVRGPGAGAATSRLLRPQRRRVFADVLRRDVPVDRASRPGLAPLILGNASGTPIGDVPRQLRMILWASAVVTVVVLAIRNWGWILCSVGEFRACMQWTLEQGYSRRAGVPPPRQIPTLPLTLVGPVGYIVAMAVWRRRRGKTAPV